MVVATSVQDRLLVPDRNCWRLESTERVRFLIDASSYFSAFTEAVERARKQVLILGWDVHGGTHLRRRPGRDEKDHVLGTFLHDVLSRRHELHIYVLSWDFSVLFALERDWTPLFRSHGWIDHPRLHFRYDDAHPIGASHHQKIVVVDDAVAFVGGIDLTQRRWDTPEHDPQDHRRRDPSGRAYGPFHDVQVLVDDKAAAALGELARDRWKRATRDELPPPGQCGHDPWPGSLAADVEDVSVAIATTVPESESDPGSRDVEQLYLDTLAAARRFVYVENQYFTSSVIADAIERRLREADGPEVLMILPRDCSGWLEEGTMGLLRARLIEKLRDADEHGHFHAYYPVTSDPATSDEIPTNVHSKVMIVDDRLVRIGSSNLSNRSMGLDTECDLAFEGHGIATVERAIADFRNRLLAEHLGVAPGDVRSALETEGSFRALLARYRDGERGLRPVETNVDGWGVFVPDQAIVDPGGPEAPSRVVEEFVHEDVPESTKNPVVRMVVLIAALAGLAAAWRWTPLGQWVEPDIVTAWATGLRGNPWAALIVTGVYVIASLLMVPVTGLILATALTFESGPAIAYSLLGAVASGLVGFSIGHVLARNTVRRLAGSRLNRVSKLLGRGGIVSVIALRVLPVAPFTIANIVAGASHIRARDFALGTALGLAPGIVAINLFKNQARNAVRDPGLGSVLFLTGTFIVIVLAIAWARRTLHTLASDEQ